MKTSVCKLSWSKMAESVVQLSKLFAISDIHVDAKLNKDYVFSWDKPTYKDAGLLVAGDVTDNFDLLKETLKHFTDKFKAVFFVPGKSIYVITIFHFRTNIY